ncbi:Ig-like domain-containing protein [Parabacteroides sp.]
MKQLLPIILIGLCPHWLQAQSQIWETGTFMCVAEETGSWQAGAGQPFSETNPKSCFLYGCTEIVSSIQEEEEIESILLDMKVLTLEEGESGQLYATIKADDSANQAMTWYSANPKVAAITPSGKVTALRAGKTILTVTTASGNYADECEVTVTKASDPEPAPIPVEEITLNLTSATLERGESLRLIATVSPADADDTSVRWSTSDPAIADVDQTGLVLALSAGNATITATTNDGGKSASCEVTVNELPTSIEAADEHRIIYPRVVKDRFYLNLPAPQTVYLIDANGRIVRVFQAQAGETVIPMSGYPSGIYWVRLPDQAISILKE